LINLESPSSDQLDRQSEFHKEGALIVSFEGGVDEIELIRCVASVESTEWRDETPAEEPIDVEAAVSKIILGEESKKEVPG